MPCLWRLPVNAHSKLVALCRPITFLTALVFAFGAFAYSTFLNFSGLAPLECRCPSADKSPRTRPRPQPHSTSPPVAPSSPATPKPSPLDSFSSFSSFVAESFRPRRPPPVARRGSHNKTLPYPVHELDEVVEEEDGEGTELREERPDTDGEEPGLTPDVSEGEDTESLETMEDAHVEPPPKKTRSKGVNFFGTFKWKKHHSDDSLASSSGSRSPSEDHKPSPSSASTHSEQPHASPPRSAFASAGARPRSATSSTTSNRSVHFTGRRQTPLDSVSSASSNEPLAGAPSSVLRSRKPLSISTSPSSSSSQPARTLFSKSSFRSLSPLSKSPVTTPDPSPPSSPRSNHCPFSKHLATRLHRSHSLDSPSRGRRTRAVSPVPATMPRLRRGMSANESLGIDSTGSSDLKLDDLLH